MIQNVQSREVERFDRFLAHIVHFLRRGVDSADERVHRLEVFLRRDFSQRREQSEAQPPSPAPRSFAVGPQDVRRVSSRLQMASIAGSENVDQARLKEMADDVERVFNEPRQKATPREKADFLTWDQINRENRAASRATMAGHIRREHHRRRITAADFDSRFKR